MPSTKIAEIQLQILRAIEAIEAARKLLASSRSERRVAQAEVEKQLGILARLNHERTRLMSH